MATACSSLIGTFGGYVAPFILLLSLAVAALILNLTLKRP
jgi:OFA family oxalate/formate antiporter-like MFS transporter